MQTQQYVELLGNEKHLIDFQHKIGIWEKLFGGKEKKEELGLKKEDIEFPAEDSEFEDVYGKPQDFDAGEQP